MTRDIDSPRLRRTARHRQGSAVSVALRNSIGSPPVRFPSRDSDVDLRGVHVLPAVRCNGYVLEQVLSPLVVVTSPEHEELVALAPDCLTRWHSHHYRGFAKNQWDDLFGKTG